MNNDIKPCPLCGGRALMSYRETASDWSGEWEIECPKCYLILNTYYLLDQAKPNKNDSKEFNRELAITRWNRRA